MVNILDIGTRLKEERERLSLSQIDLATATGVERKTQANYEAGRSEPTAGYLARAAHLGFDISYVVLGVPAASLATEEQELLRRFRGATDDLRAGALAVLGVSGSARTGVHIAGDVTHVSHGPMTGANTYNVGGKGGRKKRGSAD